MMKLDIEATIVSKNVFQNKPIGKILKMKGRRIAVF